MKKNEYRGFYKKYDMNGRIDIGTGSVQVCDIFDDIPSFMYDADVLFIDPPCNNRNLNFFYNKTDEEKKGDISSFNIRLFTLISEISPRHVFIEAFKSNKEKMISHVVNLGYEVDVYDSYYYYNEKNRCWIIHGRKPDEEKFDLPYTDEEKIIEFICKNLQFECIGDLCIGKGLVGFYANQYAKKFVGTELNHKRLACLIEHINQGKIIVR